MSYDLLAARMESLEIRLRRTRLVLAVTLLAAGAVFVTGAGPGAWHPVQEPLRAVAFEVVDGSGRTVARLGSDLDGGLLTVWDHAGRDLAYVGVTSGGDGGLLALKSTSGSTGVYSGVRPDGGGYLQVDRLGRTVGYLGASTNQEGGLFFLGHDGGRRVLEAGVMETGGGYLSVNEPGGAAAVTLP